MPRLEEIDMQRRDHPTNPHETDTAREEVRRERHLEEEIERARKNEDPDQPPQSQDPQESIDPEEIPLGGGEGE
jgi:hypothetical protein